MHGTRTELSEGAECVIKLQSAKEQLTRGALGMLSAPRAGRVAGQGETRNYRESDTVKALSGIFSQAFMGTSLEVSQLEVTRRFLLRFADLMSNGSNATNLLLAAELLESYANRAVGAEQRLREAASRSSDLEGKLAALSHPDQIQIPRVILRLAKSQFESLFSEFERSGNVIGQAMCQASASTLARYLGGQISTERSEPIKPNETTVHVLPTSLAH
jgi:hypothetical protein